MHPIAEYPYSRAQSVPYLAGLSPHEPGRYSRLRFYVAAAPRGGRSQLPRFRDSTAGRGAERYNFMCGCLRGRYTITENAVDQPPARRKIVIVGLILPGTGAPQPARLNQEEPVPRY